MVEHNKQKLGVQFQLTFAGAVQITIFGNFQIFNENCCCCCKKTSPNPIFVFSYRSKANRNFRPPRLQSRSIQHSYCCVLPYRYSWRNTHSYSTWFVRPMQYSMWVGSNSTYWNSFSVRSAVTYVLPRYFERVLSGKLFKKLEKQQKLKNMAMNCLLVFKILKYWMNRARFRRM